MRNIYRVIGLAHRYMRRCRNAYLPACVRERFPPCVARVCSSIMATITRSVHSISFFLCLPRLFHPLVLATVLRDRRAQVLYRAMLTLFLLSNVHRVSSFTLRSSRMRKNTFDLEYRYLASSLRVKRDVRMFRSSEKINFH